MAKPFDVNHQAKVLNERLVAKLRLRHLRLLAALERHTTLSEAAREVGVTQPAASQILRELEDLMDLPLFERHARGLRATPAGQLMAQQSRHMLSSLGYAAEALAASALGHRRPLNIGAIPAALSGLVRPNMPRLRQQLTGWSVSFHEGMPADMLALLHSGAVQLVLLRQPESLTDQRLVFTPLLADELVVVASPRHVAARRKVVDLADLAPHPWSLPVGTLATGQVFEQACQAAGFTPRRAEMQSMALTLLQPIIDDTKTLAALPRSIAVQGLASGELAHVKLRHPIPLPPLGALHHADETSPAIDTLIEVLSGR